MLKFSYFCYILLKMLHYIVLSKFPKTSPNSPKAKKISKFAFLGEKSPKLATLGHIHVGQSTTLHAVVLNTSENCIFSLT
jgi:hypothetical protein